MHSFLELKTPKDSVASSLNNKSAFLLYQQILKNSTVANSKSGNLFTDPEQALGTKIESRADVIYPMKRLMEDKLILHMFYLSFIDRRDIKIQSYFISAPAEKSENIEIIYKNILNISIQNILLQIDGNLKFNVNTFKAELDINLKHNLLLMSENYPISFVKIFPHFDDSINEIPIHAKVKEAVMEDIEEELILRNKIVKLGNGLYFPISSTEIIERFNMADEFIKKEIAPIYYSVIGKEMESIRSQEDIYDMEPFHEPLTSLKKERAEILHRTISPYHTDNYPGELAIMTVLLFEKYVLESLVNREELLINEEVNKFRTKFLEPAKHWRDILHFINEEAVNNVHPKVWDKLRNDKSLVFAFWYLAKEEVYVFAPRKVTAFLNCIKDMNIQTPDLTWKILAFKNLLEINEQYLPGLFSNQDTIRLYGNLLSKAYMEYFPWYYPLFIYINYFKDIFFASAKKKIQTQQWELESRIRSRKKDIEKARIIKYKKITDEKVIETRRKEIIDCMDNSYFKENVIPTKQLLLQKCRLQNSEVIDATLKKFDFQIISILGDEKNDRLAVLYPLDHEWRGRELRLKKMLSKKMEVLVENPTIDKKLILPFKLVLNHITSQNKLRVKQEDELEDISFK